MRGSPHSCKVIALSPDPSVASCQTAVIFAMPAVWRNGFSKATCQEPVRPKRFSTFAADEAKTPEAASLRFEQNSRMGVRPGVSVNLQEKFKLFLGFHAPAEMRQM
jgi:hypothetical protein